MREELGKIALAGLLHDIGKFGQRAGERAEGKSEHAAVGDKFVQNFVPAHWRDSLGPVGWHHGDPEGKATEVFDVQVVMVADRLSAGERERLGEEETGIHPPQMVTPFSHLARPETDEEAWLPLAPLTLKKEALFARPAKLPKEEEQTAYRRLWREFCAEAQNLKSLHEKNPELEAYLLSLLDLLLRYTWCLPSAFYYAVPDVSLYDHLRTTAAIAVALYAGFHENQEALKKLLVETREKDPKEWPSEPAVAVLAEGDLSGIQDFIYALKNPRGAAASLRARSFYLQVLTEVLARWILRRLGLPPTNLLYCGGGRFRLLLPPGAIPALEELRAEANGVLLHAHHGALYLALAGVPLTPAHFAPAPVHKEDGIWQADRGLRAAEAELQKALDSQKNRRFLELPPEDLARFFQPFGAEKRICHVCGEAVPDSHPDEEDVEWCKSCESFRELGRNLRWARFLRLIWQEERELPENPSWQEILARFGFAAEVHEDLPSQIPNPSLLYRLTDDPLSPRHAAEAVARKFLVNIVPIWQEGEKPPEARPEYTGRPGDIKHFGILAYQSQGAPYLGILRMDMDNLGRIFRDGFIRKDKEKGEPVDHGTFSRKHSLSTLLSVFFEGWVAEALRAIFAEEETKRIYAVYSGGDDLFLVGSWDAVLKAALRIRKDFAEFSGRKDLGISGALILVHEKYPLYLAAQRAGEVLEREAKATEEKEEQEFLPRKDRFWFLGRATPWQVFCEEVEKQKEKLVLAVKEDEAARRILFVLQEVWEEYEEERKKGREWGPWLWRTAYWLARQREMAKSARRDPSLYEDLGNKLSGERFSKNIGVLGLAARWAELATRKVKRERG